MKKIPHKSIVDSLIYVKVCTRLNIAHVVGIVSQFISNLGKEYLIIVKQIFRYLSGISTIYLYFGNGKHVLDRYTDYYMVGARDSKRYAPGYLITFLERQYHVSISYKNVLFYPSQRLNILQL